MAVPALRQTFLDTLVQCASLAAQPTSDDSRGWLEREIDRQVAKIAQAFADDPVRPFSVDEFQSNVQFLFDFARTRAAFVVCQVVNNVIDDASGCDPTTVSPLRFRTPRL